MVSRAFSALCVYSKFGHHPPTLGYLSAKFSFFCGLHCWAGPCKKLLIIHSLTHPAYLMPQDIRMGKLKLSRMSCTTSAQARIEDISRQLWICAQAAGYREPDCSVKSRSRRCWTTRSSRWRRLSSCFSWMTTDNSFSVADVLVCCNCNINSPNMASELHSSPFKV